MATHLSLGGRSDAEADKCPPAESGGHRSSNSCNSSISAAAAAMSFVREKLIASTRRRFRSDLRELESYHKALREERIRVAALANEHDLPYCIQLLDDAIDASREQLEDRLACKLHTPSGDDVVEPPPSDPPLIPPHAASGGNYNSSSRSLAEMHMNGGGMRWSTSPAYPCATVLAEDPVDRISWPFSVDPSLAIAAPLSTFDRSLSNTIQPHQGRSEGASMMGRFEELRAAAASSNESCVELAAMKSISIEGGVVEAATDDHQMNTRNALTTSNVSGPMPMQRKPRRCWSPELHQLFLKSLDHLGGCQVATPKQIRELMNVDGLTNDEVKSHLQKFRLHMRRPSVNMAEDQPSKQGDGCHELVVFRCNTDHHHHHHHRHHHRHQLQRSFSFAACDTSEVSSMEEDGHAEAETEHDQKGNNGPGHGDNSGHRSQRFALDCHGPWKLGAFCPTT